MKKVFTLLLVFIITFQFSGGYAVAAILNNLSAQTKQVSTGQYIVSPKKCNVVNTLWQILETDAEEECAQWLVEAFALNQHLYFFKPVFSVQNKHFLIHYASAIKGKLPHLYLTHHFFRL